MMCSLLFQLVQPRNNPETGNSKLFGSDYIILDNKEQGCELLEDCGEFKFSGGIGQQMKA